MDINASDIYSFYQSSLGSIVKRTVRQRITSALKDISNQSVCGYGYTSPYLSFLKKSHANLNITSLIPDFLDGSITEKYDFDEKTIHEYFLPLDPSSVDLVVSTHLLEFVEKPISSIEEIWRILKPNGYFIALVPRRSGLWTRYDNNHFGHGRSYSTTRLIEDYLIKHVPIHQLYANISSNNSESISLFEKNSYKKVGLKKDWLYYNNMFCDELLYQKIIKK